MKTLSRALVALVAAAGVATLPSAAHAERAVYQDGAGDVIASNFDSETGTSSEEPAPGQSAGDIVKTVVRHTDSKVIVVVKFADLRRSDDLTGHFLRLVTNEGAKRNVFVEATSTKPQGTVMISRPSGPAKCDGLTRAIDYTANTLRVATPRSCLSSPRWVRVGVSTYVYPSNESYNGFIDDANKDGAYGAQPTLGARVAKG